MDMKGTSRVEFVKPGSLLANTSHKIIIHSVIDYDGSVKAEHITMSGGHHEHMGTKTD